MSLFEKKCTPCEGGAAPLSDAAARELLAQVSGWRIEDGKLRRSVALADFRAAMAFLNRVAAVAEKEGHHPDFCVHYNRVEFTLWTHAAAGLTENDFILAAKIGRLEPRRGRA
jgi:4a-hydroxytetrahydrobiopterin dehydratase